jgi:predicted GNAT family acetyltransferase
VRGYAGTVSHELTHEPDANRYVLRINGSLAATVDYRITGNLISFTRTFTTPALRGQGLAGVVTEFAVNDVEATTQLRIVPMCWYVGEWFDKHPERAALLTR